MRKASFEMFHKWAEDCMKANAYLDSKSAFTLISQIAKKAAQRGQRKTAASPAPSTRLEKE